MKLKKSTHFITIGCLLLVTNYLFSAEVGQNDTPYVAIIDLQPINISNMDAKALSERLRFELFSTGKFRIMERELMNEILTEQGLQLSGCTSKQCYVQVGQIIGVEYIITGSISNVANVYSIILKMVDVKTGEIIVSVAEDTQADIGEVLLQGISNISKKLTFKIFNPNSIYEENLKFQSERLQSKNKTMPKSTDEKVHKPLEPITSKGFWLLKWYYQGEQRFDASGLTKILSENPATVDEARMLKRTPFIAVGLEIGGFAVFIWGVVNLIDQDEDLGRFVGFTGAGINFYGAYYGLIRYPIQIKNAISKYNNNL